MLYRVMDDRPIGLIAGNGQLPVLTARGIHAAGRRVACVGLADQFDPQLPACCDRFTKAGVIQLGKWIRVLRRLGCAEVIMVGGVCKARVYQPMRVWRQLPDWRAARLWYRVLRQDRRDQNILAAVADELDHAGLHMIDSTTYIPEHLATPGVLTRKRPTSEQMADVQFAWGILQQLADLDVGQAMAVKDRDIIAVEAIEGTDRMIDRAGALCRSGKWTLLKSGGTRKDMRFDVPTIGVKTIERLKTAKAACVALGPGVIMIDKPRVIEAADKAGIAIIGVAPPETPEPPEPPETPETPETPEAASSTSA